MLSHFWYEHEYAKTLTPFVFHCCEDKNTFSCNHGMNEQYEQCGVNLFHLYPFAFASITLQSLVSNHELITIPAQRCFDWSWSIQKFISIQISRDLDCTYALLFSYTINIYLDLTNCFKQLFQMKATAYILI